MSDLNVNDILEEMCAEEANEYMRIRAPLHRFSRRHRKAMRDILQPRAQAISTTCESYMQRIPFKRKIWIAVMVIILAAIGITAGAAAINGFWRNKHRDYTELLTVNAENCPKTIENVYYLPEMPEGYELYEVSQDNWKIYTSYINRDTSECMVFVQDVKDGYKDNFNTEYRDFEELDINGHYALYLDFSNSEQIRGLIVWDNEDYVLQVSGNFTKSELVNLAKSAKF